MSTQSMGNNQQNPVTAINTDVLIVGAGLAGLSVALSLPRSLKVTVLSKDSLSKCASYYAQGGIAGMIAPDDSVTNHVKDTLLAGDGLCHPSNTGQILQQGAAAISWLCEQGVAFTTQHPNNQTADNLTSYPESLHLTREGGHSHRRIAHVDDATGKHVMDTLITNAQSHSHIELLLEHEAIELLTDDELSLNARQTVTNDISNFNVKNHASITANIDNKHTKQCYGAKVLNRKTNTAFIITAQSVVLATGGLGQLFKRATAPSVSIGDGVMMAWQAACRRPNLEFVQFHPTGLACQGQQPQLQQQNESNFLISEAVRGEGGLLYCPVSGERFMIKVDERAELAPRDIVARAIYQQGKLNGLGYVYLDISHRPAGFIQQHFPQIYQHCLEVGLDITQQPIPVAPTAHYSCGGVLTTAEGLSDVIGLYAVGEVAYTGLHGANRLASNSLLECVVVGRQVARHLAHSLAYHTATDMTNTKKYDTINNKVNQLVDCWQMPRPQCIDDIVAIDSSDNFAVNKPPVCLHDIKAKGLMTFLEDTPNHDDTTYHQKVANLKQLMNDTMGIERNHHDLQLAYHQLTAWQASNQCEVKSQKAPQLAHSMGCLTDIDFLTDIQAVRWQRLLTLAQLMVKSALIRTESRGGHYRSDYLTKAKQAKVSVID